jgi:transcriptional regulator with XRE-family HTH domain
MTGIEFRRLRLIKGYTQKQVGELIGLSESRVCVMENSEGDIKKSYALAIESIDENQNERTARVR